MLHLTNGDQTVELLTAAEMPGDSFAWRDVLHDGPVPAGLDTSALAQIRAEYIASRGWGQVGDIAADFRLRDEKLDDLAQVDELVLWFEHDLYDQLQILQILDRLALLPEERRPQRWSMICIDRFPGVVRFCGLGQLSPTQIASLFPDRQPLTQDQLRLGQQGWAAFCAKTPELLNALLTQDLSPLPFLANAIRRHLQQFPNADNGLNLTEQIALEGIASGVIQTGALFRYQNNRETHPFLGDWSFWQVLQKLQSAPKPAIKMTNQGSHPPAWHTTAQLTAFGKSLLAGKADFVETNGVNQWLGGVHLQGKDIPWRWQSSDKNLIASVSS